LNAQIAAMENAITEKPFNSSCNPVLSDELVVYGLDFL